ncbi:class I adenylate-forming enzyme family protein [Erythrobacter sp. BLCC-B19]|uniref:class I adenylate-forming enzyme family protein n=1 Tax=Erythrobacter sp. BLCC-B19 TaxID=3025315 RepID=UPI00235ED651|nr:class I adenylate-forming enzyme family protein [Erythrobacter sp. BLCC-B19]WDA40948.1 class I adenylate-forming enzyme family protein [Erythrobacter sp. BLCC-B19]
MQPIEHIWAANQTKYARQLACTRIHDLLASHADAIPGATAAVDGELRLTYADLAAQVDAIARGLIAAGIRPGDRVATMVPPSLEFWLTYLASVSVGAVWMGLNPRYQLPEYAYLLADATPRLVFTVSEYEGRPYGAELQEVGAAVERFVSFGAPTGRAESFAAFLAGGQSVSDADLAARRAAVDPEDIAVIVYTSGTTGKPKGAMLSHRAIMAAALCNLCWMDDGLESTISVAPINHVGALNNVCMNVFAYGGKIVFHHRVDLAAIAEITAREELTYLVASPTSFAMLAAQPDAGAVRLGSYRLIVFGGGATAEALLKPVHATGVRMYNVYGQTETCGIVTATDDGASPKIMAETFGRALPGATIRIGDAQGTPLPPGTPGEIQVSGPYCMSGYFNRPEATAEAFTADGYLRTGDIGVEQPDGNISFVGRLKEMFKSGGYNIYPVEIELALNEHPAVTLAAVLPVPHPVFQEVGHAFIETGDAALDAPALRDFLKPRLANYKIPKSFSFEPELPKLPNSKIDKQALKRRLAEKADA